jgi:hypothetical protein
VLSGRGSSGIDGKEVLVLPGSMASAATDDDGLTEVGTEAMAERRVLQSIEVILAHREDTSVSVAKRLEAVRVLAQRGPCVERRMELLAAALSDRGFVEEDRPLGDPYCDSYEAFQRWYIDRAALDGLASHGAPALASLAAAWSAGGVASYLVEAFTERVGEAALATLPPPVIAAAVAAFSEPQSGFVPEKALVVLRTAAAGGAS